MEIDGFYAWIDQRLPEPLPEDVKGIYFKLFDHDDGFAVEMVGTSSFSERNPVWAAGECWKQEENCVPVPKEISGETWEECLEMMKNAVAEYLNSGNRSDILKSVGVGIGFFDGDLHLLWNPYPLEARGDIYEYIGTYPNSDARILLDAYVEAEIDYTLDVDKMGLQNMSAAETAYGGTFGAGVGMAIGVHVDDVEEALEIRQRVFKIMP